jgi:hypothetical protein
MSDGKKARSLPTNCTVVAARSHGLDVDLPATRPRRFVGHVSVNGAGAKGFRMSIWPEGVNSVEGDLPAGVVDEPATCASCVDHPGKYEIHLTTASRSTRASRSRSPRHQSVVARARDRIAARRGRRSQGARRALVVLSSDFRSDDGGGGRRDRRTTASLPASRTCPSERLDPAPAARLGRQAVELAKKDVEIVRGQETPDRSALTRRVIPLASS